MCAGAPPERKKVSKKEQSRPRGGGGKRGGISQDSSTNLFYEAFLRAHENTVVGDEYKRCVYTHGTSVAGHSVCYFIAR